MRTECGNSLKKRTNEPWEFRKRKLSCSLMFPVLKKRTAYPGERIMFGTFYNCLFLAFLRKVVLKQYIEGSSASTWTTCGFCILSLFPSKQEITEEESQLVARKLYICNLDKFLSIQSQILLVPVQSLSLFASSQLKVFSFPWFKNYISRH